MQAIALTRASELLQATDTLEQLGVSVEPILERAQLPMWHYCDPDDLIPKHHVFEFMDRVARSLDIPTFGLVVASQTSLSSMGPFGRLVASSITTHHALVAGCRTVHLHNYGSRLWLDEADDEVWFWHSESDSPNVGRWQKEQFVLKRMIDHVRLGAGPSWLPAKICLRMPKAREAELREALGDPEISFEQKLTGIAIPRALLALPLRRRAKVPVDASETLEERLRRTAPGSSFVDTLRQVTGSLLKQEESPRIEAMAEIAGLSVRSLQRRLAKQGLCHFQIVDQARYQAAAKLLKNSDIRITDIAMDLGYSDSAHFTRAFRRWAGVTPKAYRFYQETR